MKKRDSNTIYGFISTQIGSFDTKYSKSSKLNSQNDLWQYLNPIYDGYRSFSKLNYFFYNE